MSFDWADYLKLAEALQSNPEVPGAREASLRAATSRAYYAALLKRTSANALADLTIKMAQSVLKKLSSLRTVTDSASE